MEGSGDDILSHPMPENVIAPPKLLELEDEIDDDDEVGTNTVTSC